MQERLDQNKFRLYSYVLFSTIIVFNNIHYGFPEPNLTLLFHLRLFIPHGHFTYSEKYIFNIYYLINVLLQVSSKSFRFTQIIKLIIMQISPHTSDFLRIYY